MSFLSDILLATGAFAAAVYCLVLARRLKALTGLDSGMGTAIAVLSAQVDELNRTLQTARDTAQGMTGRLGNQTERAEAAARRLELLIAALHDLPDPADPMLRAQRAQGHRDRGGPDLAGMAAGSGGGSGASSGASSGAGAVRARVLRRRATEPAL